MSRKARPLLAVLGLLGLAGGAASALARPAPGKDLRDPPASVSSYRWNQFTFPAGSTSVFLAGNDSGQLAGQLIDKAGWSHPIAVLDNRLHYYLAQFGEGNFAAISPLGHLAGTLGGKPAFLVPGRQPILASQPGSASAITLDDIVGATLTTPNGPWAVDWNPHNGVTLELGRAHLSGMNSEGWNVGYTDTGYAWSALVKNGTVITHTYGWQGDLVRVNNRDLATGYRLVNSQYEPVAVELDTGRIIYYKLPPGYQDGSALSANDVNIGGVNAFRDQAELQSGHATPVIYPRGPGNPVIVSTIPGVGLVGIRLADLSYVSDGGQLVGAADRGQFEMAVRLSALHLAHKLSSLGDIIDEEEYDIPDVSDHLLFHLEEAYSAIAATRTESACEALSDAGEVLDQERAGLVRSNAAGVDYEISYYDDIDGTVSDLYSELGCSGRFVGRLLGLNSQQSPYGTTPLA